VYKRQSHALARIPIRLAVKKNSTAILVKYGPKVMRRV